MLDDQAYDFMGRLIMQTKQKKINWLPLFLCRDKIILPRELEVFLHISENIVLDSSFIFSYNLGAVALIHIVKSNEESKKLYVLPNYSAPMIEIGANFHDEHTVQELWESINSNIYNEPELPAELYEFFNSCLQGFGE